MKRIQWIDYAKGLTIFLVLVVHVFDGIHSTGVFEEYNFVTELAMFLVFTVIMPCFFALSGWLYKRELSISGYLQNIRKNL